MKLLIALVATLLLSTCSSPPSLLERVLAEGELRVVSRNSPDAYFLGSRGPEGPAYDLASAFAASLGVKLRLYPVRTREAAVAEVEAGRAHLAAAGLSTGQLLPDGVVFGPGYQTVREHLVQRRRAPLPASLTAAAHGQIEVGAGGAHQRTLDELRAQYPDLVWVERADTDVEEILAQVARGSVQYTLASTTEFSLSRLVNPDLEVALDLSPERAIAWVVSAVAEDKSLLGRVNAFFAARRADGSIDRLLERYYGRKLAEEEDFPQFDRLLSRSFLRHLETRLPTYLAWFREAAALHGVDWRLLAAMGYQESKWDPDAVSYTGVRGLMQLTQDTATLMRAGDRTDPRSSIFGGAKYLAQLMRKVPARVHEPDRTWMAVAAYNVGYGHVEDARILAQQQGRNPDRWEDVRSFLPYLSQERWYTQTRNGYARGWEPVQYVDNVQAFLNILEVAGTGVVARPTG